MDTENKDLSLIKRTIKRYSAELRLVSQFYQMLPGDGYDSYKGLRRPPKMKSQFGVDHVFYPVEIIYGSGPTEEDEEPDERPRAAVVRRISFHRVRPDCHVR